LLYIHTHLVTVIGKPAALLSISAGVCTYSRTYHEVAGVSVYVVDVVDDA